MQFSVSHTQFGLINFRDISSKLQRRKSQKPSVLRQ